MRGQAPTDAQRQTVERLRSKGWRGDFRDMFALAVPTYFDRPFAGLPRPHVVHVRPDGGVRKGYPRADRA